MDSELPGQRTRLRIGLLLDSTTVPAWMHDMLRRVADSNFAELCFVAVREPRAGNGTVAGGGAGRAMSPGIVRGALESAYRYMIRNEDRVPDALEARDIAGLVEGVDQRRVAVRDEGELAMLSEDDVNAIAQARLDVLLSLAGNEPGGRLLEVPRYGVWSYLHADSRQRHGGPAGFWEVAQGLQTTGVELRILGAEGRAARVLQRSWSSTPEYSVDFNRDGNFWKAHAFVPRKLEELHRVGPDAFFEEVRRTNQHPEFQHGPLHEEPTFGQQLAFTFRVFATKVARRRHRSSIEQWALRFDLHDELSTRLRSFRVIDPPLDRIWADPFVVQRDGKYYIFIEQLVTAEKRGHIAVIVMDEDGNCSSPVRVLERPYHLSYPFIFEYEGELYMIPETAEREAIEVYRCRQFPDQWELHTTLAEGVRAVDTTLVEHEGRWWMFTNMVEHPGSASWDELFLFYADSPLSQEWTPHAKNPVVSDVRRARCAGNFLRKEGRLYRPSQNSAPSYGYAVNLHEVIELTPERYSESLVSSIEPNWSPELLGVHTLNHCGRLTIVDVLQRRKT